MTRAFAEAPQQEMPACLLANRLDCSERLGALLAPQRRRRSAAPPEWPHLVTGGSAPAGVFGSKPVELTETEAAILEGISEGKSDSEMATELRLPQPTVIRNTRSLYQKLGVSEPGHAVGVAYRFGLLVPPVRVKPSLGLTPREAQVLAELAYGKPNYQIARALYIKEDTVKTHVKAILRKLGVNNRTEAILRARNLGILT